MFSQWTEDVGTCGPFTYTPRLADGRPWPSFITFSEPLRKFEVYSNNFSHVGIYNIEMKGQVGAYIPIEYVYFKVTIPCYLDDFYAQTRLEKVYYSILTG